MIPKFRAWEPYKNKMNYKVMVGNCDTDDENWTCPIIWDKEKREWVHFDSTDYIMQSTGLKDTNGVEIFEGDVVRYGSSSYDSFVCGWSEEEPALRAISKIELLELTFWKDETEGWEVIGNIYENPELVEHA